MRALGTLPSGSISRWATWFDVGGCAENDVMDAMPTAPLYTAEVSDGSTIALVERAPTPEEYGRLRASVGWNELSPDAIRAGLSGSLYSVVLERDGEAVGCGRVVGDGGVYFYVQDVIVAPELQGLGWGARIMDAVMHLDASVRPGSFIGLMAAKDAEGFYRRYGFERRPDDRPGMFRIR
jgi:ribosomal protein S18 acetylase RimI-like enzyme